MTPKPCISAHLLCTLPPMPRQDVEAVVQSVTKTGRLIVSHEAPQTGGQQVGWLGGWAVQRIGEEVPGSGEDGACIHGGGTSGMGWDAPLSAKAKGLGGRLDNLAKGVGRA